MPQKVLSVCIEQEIQCFPGSSIELHRNISLFDRGQLTSPFSPQSRASFFAGGWDKILALGDVGVEALGDLGEAVSAPETL
jgi:hypothetical protein